MIIRRKPTGILNRRRPIGSLGQRLLQRSVAQVRRMVISRLPQRNPDWESPSMIWNRDYAPDEQDYEAGFEEYTPQPDWTHLPAKAPSRRSGPTPSVQPAREDEPMPVDLQAIFNLHKSKGRVTGESFLHRDAEPDSQKITKTPPTAKPVQASGRYEPPPQRPVTPRNAPPTPEPAESEPPPVQRRVMSKVEYMGVRNMAEEFGLAEPTSESAEDYEEGSFEDDMPDALPGTFEDRDEDDDFGYDSREAALTGYNESVSAAIAKAEAPTPRTASSHVQASPMDDDPQKFTQTLIEQQTTSVAGEQAAQSTPNTSTQSSQPPTTSSPATPSAQAGQAGQADQAPPSSQPDQSAGPVDPMFMGAAPSVIEESENIQRKPADTPQGNLAERGESYSEPYAEPYDEARAYTSDQLSAAIAQAEAPVSRAEPQVVRAKRIDSAEPTVQPMVRPTAYTRIVDEVEEQPRREMSQESAAPSFERRVTGQAVMGGEEFSPRPVENLAEKIHYAAPAITPPATPSPAPSSVPSGRVARMPQMPDMPNIPNIMEAPEVEMPAVQRQAVPLDEVFETSLPRQSVSLDEALEMSGTLTEVPPPVLMPPIGKTRHRDIAMNQSSPESARPPVGSTAAASASSVQRSITPSAAVQRAEAPAPDGSNTQSEQGLLSLLNLPADTPIQRDGPPMPNVEVTPTVQTMAIQRETSAAPTSSASGGTENAGEGEGADKAEVEKMATEVYRLLQRRLKVERERRSR